jgi:hypothetical protein
VQLIVVLVEVCFQLLLVPYLASSPQRCWFRPPQGLDLQGQHHRNHCVDDNHPYHHDRQTVCDRNSSSSPRGLVHRYFFYHNIHLVQDILHQDREGALAQGAFQEQTSVGTELVLASFVDPFEDGNLVQVLLGGAS